MSIGRRLGRLLTSGDLIAFKGDLGAGKTCMIKGLAQGLEVPEDCYVRSPSFVILNIYPGRFPLHHLDLYRIHGTTEVEDIGYRDIFYGEGVTAIEWAEKIPELLPDDHLQVVLAFVDEDTRKITITPCGERSQARWKGLLEKF